MLQLIKIVLLLIFLVSCSFKAKILDLNSNTTPLSQPSFDDSFLDLSKLSLNRYQLSTNSQGEMVVSLNWEEYIYNNKVGFKNLPADANLICEGTDNNLAISALDLNLGEIYFSTSFWVPSSADLTARRDQAFSCHYEVGEQISKIIHFIITLNESEIALVSVPTFDNTQRIGGSDSPMISANGQFAVFEMKANGNWDSNINNIALVNLSTGNLEIISKGSTGDPANADSWDPSISADGRYIAFESQATNLVASDTNGKFDIFVYDRQTGITTRVSVDSGGLQTNDESFYPTISGDGRYVGFASRATNLVAGDTNVKIDIFVHDRQTSATSRVSVDSAGVQASGDSTYSELSDDGRYITFQSYSTNLVAGDTNNSSDIFVHDRQTAATTRVSVDSAGVQSSSSSDSPSISGDGRYVAFESYGSNLVAGDTNSSTDIFIHDRQTNSTTRVSVNGGGVQSNSYSGDPSISTDGRYVTFRSVGTNLVAGDTNSSSDIFVFDRQSSSINRVSVSSAGIESNDYSEYSTISDDGRYILFQSDGANLVSGDTNTSSDVFLHDRLSAVTTRLTVDSAGVQANYDSYFASISDDGRFVAFENYGSNMVTNDTNDSSDVFVHDRQTGVTSRVSVDSAGVEADGDSYSATISGNGRFVLFQSYATNLVAGDTNSGSDIFLHDRQTGITSRVSVDSAGVQANGASYDPKLSSDGRFLVFTSGATNLVASDTNVKNDIFLHDRQTGVTSRISIDSAAAQSNNHSGISAVSDDGRYISFESSATNLVAGDTNNRVDIFVHDRQTSATTRVSVDSLGAQGNGTSGNATISFDGRYVLFKSNSSGFVAGDTNGSYDIFLHDRQTAATTRISVDSLGGQANGDSSYSSMSYDGRYIVFQSYATNLVPNDTDGAHDIFLQDRQTGITSRITVNSTGIEANNDSEYPSFSRDGRYIVFSSFATNLIPNHSGSLSDIFIKKMP